MADGVFPTTIIAVSPRLTGPAKHVWSLMRLMLAGGVIPQSKRSETLKTLT
jgi:hypothetical protein